MLGIIGRNWGGAYARTCDKLGIEYWIAGREWDKEADGVIIASPAETHYGIARHLLARGVPVLIEKPVTMDPDEAEELASMGGIAFAGHTRLYSPRWRAFRATLPPVNSVECVAGGTERDPWWDWGPHLVAMCLDIGFDPARARISVGGACRPLSFVVNGVHRWEDQRGDTKPLEVLVGEFQAAIQRGVPDNRLRLGAEVVKFLWSRKCPLPITPG